MNSKEKLTELISEAKDIYPTIPLVNGCKPDFNYFLADYLLANGVLCPPCKVGDTVYAIVETTCEDIDFVHTVCEFYNEEHEDLCTLPKGKCPYKYIIQKYSVAPMNLLHFSEKFGKTVFHSRKLAEEALNEQEKL